MRHGVLPRDPARRRADAARRLVAGRGPAADRRHCRGRPTGARGGRRLLLRHQRHQRPRHPRTGRAPAPSRPRRPVARNCPSSPGCCPPRARPRSRSRPYGWRTWPVTWAVVGGVRGVDVGWSLAGGRSSVRCSCGAGRCWCGGVLLGPCVRWRWVVEVPGLVRGSVVGGRVAVLLSGQGLSGLGGPRAVWRVPCFRGCVGCGVRAFRRGVGRPLAGGDVRGGRPDAGP